MPPKSPKSTKPTTAIPKSLTNCILSNKWKIGTLLSSSGACCAGVYICTSISTKYSNDDKTRWVVKVTTLPHAASSKSKKKLTDKQRNADTLFYEHTLYNHRLVSLRDAEMIPEIPEGGRGYGESVLTYGGDGAGAGDGEMVRYFIMQSMSHTWSSYNSPTGINSMASIASTIVTTLETLHKLKLVYVDVKPDNIMLTAQNAPKLLDFGLCTPYILAGKSEHRPDTPTPGSIQAGTPQYCSVYVHSGGLGSRRDDVEGVGFCVWEKILVLENQNQNLHGGKGKGALSGWKLPWAGCESDAEGHLIKLQEVNKLISNSAQYESEVWNGLRKFFKYITGVGYEDKPDYDKCRGYLSEIGTAIKATIKAAAAASVGKKGRKSLSKKKEEVEEEAEDEDEEEVEVRAVKKSPAPAGESKSPKQPPTKPTKSKSDTEGEDERITIKKKSPSTPISKPQLLSPKSNKSTKSDLISNRSSTNTIKSLKSNGSGIPDITDNTVDYPGLNARDDDDDAPLTLLPSNAKAKARKLKDARDKAKSWAKGDTTMATDAAVNGRKDKGNVDTSMNDGVFDGVVDCDVAGDVAGDGECDNDLSVEIIEVVSGGRKSSRSSSGSAGSAKKALTSSSSNSKNVKVNPSSVKKAKPNSVKNKVMDETFDSDDDSSDDGNDNDNIENVSPVEKKTSNKRKAKHVGAYDEVDLDYDSEEVVEVKVKVDVKAGYKLRVTHGPHLGQEYAVESGCSLKIGRGRDDDEAVTTLKKGEGEWFLSEAEEISQIHCSISATGIIKDLWSTNKTFVNDKKVAARGVGLIVGDEIRIGECLVTVCE